MNDKNNIDTMMQAGYTVNEGSGAGMAALAALLNSLRR